jgi:hypothetical protein
MHMPHLETDNQHLMAVMAIGTLVFLAAVAIFLWMAHVTPPG